MITYFLTSFEDEYNDDVFTANTTEDPVVSNDADESATSDPTNEK